MRTVREELGRLGADRFTGRESELRRMEAEALHPEWRMVYLHGLSGLGKTALLRQFCRRNPNIPAFFLHLQGPSKHARGWPCDYAVHVERFVPENETPPVTEAGFAIGLEELQDRLPGMMAADSPTVLIFDSIDDWKPVSDWLRVRFFPSLPVAARVFAASRFPPDASWTGEAGWARSIVRLELRPLDQIASFRYIESYGIRDFETCHYLSKFARGLPVALRILCEDTIESGIEEVCSNYYKQQFYDRISRQLLQGMPLGDDGLDMLDAASLLWNFDIDAISRLLEVRVPAASFRAFCDLPIVEPTDAGWRIVKAARFWFRKEFARRAPERYAAMVNRARRYWMDKLEAADSEAKRNLYVNLLYLTDNDVLHTYCYQESLDQYVIRPLRREELGAVREMYVSFHNVMPAFFRESTYQEQYLETYWELSPETFFGFYRGGRLAVFMSMLPLTPGVRRELQRNPVYRNYIARSEETEGDTVMWIAAFLPEYGASAVGEVFLYGFSKLAGRGRMIVITPFLEAHRLMEGIGFEPLPWADYTTENGLYHKACRLDLKDVETLNAVMSSGSGEHRLASPPRMSREEAHAHVKNLLVHFHDFEQRADIVGRCPYMRMRCHSRQELAKAAETIRKLVVSLLETWSRSNGAQAVCGQILHLCYIRKIGTHETIAARLNLSLSTYYRHLKKGTALLAEAYVVHLGILQD
ncbi:MAG TPA: ATP-binding protein [Paenibacillaceae bacterium]